MVVVDGGGGVVKDLLRRPSSCFCVLFQFLLMLSNVVVDGTGLFKVQRKFTGSRHRSMADLRNHAARRHAWILASSKATVDLSLGGVGLPTEAGKFRLYYAQIGIGTLSTNYYVHVDTRSDLLWTNCITCNNCPTKSNLEKELTLYDPKGSFSGSSVACDDKFCHVSCGGGSPECYCDTRCAYRVMYGDGSSSGGVYVPDVVTYNRLLVVTIICRPMQAFLSGP